MIMQSIPHFVNLTGHLLFNTIFDIFDINFKPKQYFQREWWNILHKYCSGNR